MKINKMSSFFIQAKNKQTGKVENFTALDDYFGWREFGYKKGFHFLGKVYTEEEFNNLFERV